MRVLHLISSGGFYGAERVVITLANEQKKQGLDVYIGVFKNFRNPHLEIVQNAQRYNLSTNIFDCKGKFDVRTISNIRSFLKENKINIINSHGYKSNFYALLSILKMDIKKITTCHNWLGDSLKIGFYKWLDKTLLNKFDKVVVVSDVLKEEVLKSGISEEKLKVIYNGTDINKFKLPNSNYQKQALNSEEQMVNSKDKIRRKFGIKEDEKVVGTVGRLTEEKGHRYLVKAAEKVITEFPNIKFLIVGDGPLKDSLQSMAYSLQLENKVIFTGIRDDIPDILKIMDIFVMPSLKEGMPMALLEAMAAKKPVIAAKVGAIPKIIEDGYTGLLVDSGDERKLSNLIIELLRNEEKASFLAQNGCQKIKSKFSSKKMAEKYIKVYSE